MKKFIIVLFLLVTTAYGQSQGLRTQFSLGGEGLHTSLNLGGEGLNARPPAGNNDYNSFEQIAIEHSGGSLESAIPSTYAQIVSLRQIVSTAVNCIRIRENKNDTEMDIGFADGVLDIQAITNFVTDGNGLTIVKWYDQSGNGNDLIQNTSANQPQLILEGGINNLPHISFNGSGKVLTCADALSLQNSQVSLFMVAYFNSSLVQYDGLLFHTSSGSWNNGYGIHSPGTNGLIFWINNYASNYAMISISEGTPYILQFRYNQTNILAQVNENSPVTFSYTAAINNVTSTTRLFNATAIGGGYINGNIYELINFRYGVTDNQKSEIRDNINTYYSVY